MKKVKEFKTLSELRQCIDLLKNEFSLARFDLIENLVLRTSYYSFKVEFNFEDEGSAGQVSKFNLLLHGGADWGSVSSTGETTYHLDFTWTTSSGHKLQLKGFYGSENTFIEVFIGEDESSYFYPTVLELLSKIKVPTLSVKFFEIKGL
jgi:hypothetical protein